MSPLIKAILKATVGLLVNKGRDKAAERLKDGDITDQQFRNLVVRELDDIKSKIDGLARMHLLASVSFFKEGLVSLYQLMDSPELGKVDTATTRAETKDENLAVSLSLASSLVEELEVLKLNELNETAKQLLADAKKRFEDARRKATEAFSNEGLKLSDRILAMKIRIMATLLEKVDSPSIALAWCRLCLEELHKIPSVQNCFEVEIMKPFKYRFNKNERREVIAEVCHMNFVVYNVTKMVDRDYRDVFKLPIINIDNLKIDPLHDAGLIDALSEFRLERCCLNWTFGREGEKDHRLVKPRSIATNTQGQFIVADSEIVKVFDLSGKFLQDCDLLDDYECNRLFRLLSVATDGNNNLYVLVFVIFPRIRVDEADAYRSKTEVRVFDQHYNLHNIFSLSEEIEDFFGNSLTVSNDKVFVLVKRDGVLQVDVYETDGRFVDSFGQGTFSSNGTVYDITTANDGRLMVLDGRRHSVHVFSRQGDHLHQFVVQGNTACGAIAFHQPSEHVIVSSRNPDKENRGQVSIYSKDGQFVSSVQLNTGKESRLIGLTVTVGGRVAVINQSESKVHVIQC